MDPLETETARFWENHGEHNDVDPPKIQTEVFQLPTHLLRRGGRLADQLRPLAAVALEGGDAAGRGQAATSGSWRSSSCGCSALYQKEGGAFPEPILNLRWPYTRPDEPDARGARQGDQRQGARRRDRSEGRRPRSLLRRRASSSPASPSCATTARPRAAAGSTPAAGPSRQHHGAPRQHRSRRASAPIPNWAFVVAGQPPHPVQPRLAPILDGKPWDPSRKLIEWNGSDVGRHDVPDIAPTAKPDDGRAVHHEPGGRRRGCSRAA